MRILLYGVAALLMIIWAFGVMGFQAGGVIHLLIVLAIIAVVIQILRERPLSP